MHKPASKSNAFSRRIFLASSAAFAGGCAAVRRPVLAASPADRPKMLQGISSGDVTANSGIVWSRADRPSRMSVEWATTESFTNSQTILGPDATPRSDFTARVDLRELPPNQRIFYRVRFMDLSNPQAVSDALVGTFRTAPLAARNLRFAWSGDVCGQGWGINPEIGGLRVFETIRALAPDFFIHSGDTIYADQPIPAERLLIDDRIWKNLTSPAKSKPAETLEDFRGCHLYNFQDENLRKFNASVPTIAQWDDHEVLNNWFPGQVLPDDVGFTERRVNTLFPRARQAFMEYQPIRIGSDATRIYRNYAFGPVAEVFMLDERSYRGPNGANMQRDMSPASAFIGRAQLDWLKQRLRASQATWKIIAADMPISCIGADDNGYEAMANADDGAPLGRELELAELLSFCKKEKIRNLVFLTADVHHPAAIQYDPGRASAFKDFDPFWEFITGPLHAGAYPGGTLDQSFGPDIKFRLSPPYSGAGPAEGYQFFGMVEIDAKTQTLTVRQYNSGGLEKFKIDLTPVMG